MALSASPSPLLRATVRCAGASPWYDTCCASVSIPKTEVEYSIGRDEFDEDAAATATLPDPLPINGVAALLGRDRDFGNFMTSRCILGSVFGSPCS
jgi:hypothetical protein